ncbi:MAG: ATP-binding cassette domain-containing protein [Clostridia bacterium]|nr:ATP-binding cassette domain-containing protein [Clostridia bacterium]
MLNSENGIKIENLSKSYGEKKVLKNLSLFIPYGSVAAVTGGSGCGKTTLLRLICGLEKADGGSITGVNKKDISALFQEDRLFPWMTALENVEAVIKGKKEKPLAAQILSDLGLGDKKDISAFPAELSGGMMRRVAIARALAYKSKVLILDEALRGLDEKNFQNAADVIGRYRDGRTVISVTHVNSAIEENADINIKL